MSVSGIDSCSLVPLYLEQFFREKQLGHATAFLWHRRDNRLSLFTNWHVASGRNHETGECLNRMAGIPDHLRLHVPHNERGLPPLILRIPTMDEDGDPLWTEHPQFGREVDVVSLEVEALSPSRFSIMPINAIPTVRLKQRVGMPLYILGYPFGRSRYGLPVWKQGSFASEPCLAPDLDQRYLIVDTASRPGMSGSPVIQRVHGQIELEDDAFGRTAAGDGACRFVGIYSGRFHTHDASDAQLGRVWPARLVEEIADHAARGASAIGR